MFGIWELYLWRVTGKNIRNNSGNCHIVGIGQIMMSPTELRRLVGDKLVGLIDRTFVRESARYLACGEICAFFTSGVYGGHGLLSCRRVCGVFWVVFLLDLELGFVGGLLVFRWELTVLLLLQICFFFVMRGISWSISHVKIGLTLLRLSIQLWDTLMIY